MKIVKDIEDRLQGKYPKSKGLPLSVEGQVHALIKVQFSNLDSAPNTRGYVLGEVRGALMLVLYT